MYKEKCGLRVFIQPFMGIVLCMFAMHQSFGAAHAGRVSQPLSEVLTKKTDPVVYAIPNNRRQQPVPLTLVCGNSAQDKKMQHRFQQAMVGVSFFMFFTGAYACAVNQHHESATFVSALGIGASVQAVWDIFSGTRDSNDKIA